MHLHPFHDELLRSDAAYTPFGTSGPTLNAHELHYLQAPSAAPRPQYGAVTPQMAQLVAALLSGRKGIGP